MLKMPIASSFEGARMSPRSVSTPSSYLEFMAVTAAIDTNVNESVAASKMPTPSAV